MRYPSFRKEDIMKVIPAAFKKVKPSTWYLMAALILVFVLGIQTGYGLHKCAPCPEITPQTLYVHDTVEAPITTTQSVPVAMVKPRTIQQPVYRKVPATDSTPATVQTTSESVNCWDIPAPIEPDSSRTTVRLCSRAFSILPPADMTTEIERTAPQKVRIVERTSLITLPPPVAKRWGLTIGPYLGAGFDWLGRPCMSAGIAITAGYRVGKLTK